ncbi:MAG: hypothetical protein SGBAC_008656 [Bacillariaceae sp.]
MSESGSLFSEEIIEEGVEFVEEEVQSVEYIIEEEDLEVVDVTFNDDDHFPPRPTQNRRGSLVSEYVEMTLGGSSEFMSYDDLNDVADDEEEKAKSAYPSSDCGSSMQHQSSDDADATNSSDGFDLTLPETSNMENMHMSGLTLMDFTQSGMFDFEASYMFELVDSEEDEEEEESLENEYTEAAAGLNLSLNPYRVAMDKVRGGQMVKRRSTGAPKRKSTSRGMSPTRRKSATRGMSPTRQQVTDYLEHAVEAQQSARKGAPTNRVAPARTVSSSGKRRSKRRSMITSPIQEDKPHIPRRGSLASLITSVRPVFAEDIAKHPPTKTCKPNEYDKELVIPTKAIAATDSNNSEPSQLTAPGHPRAKMKETTPQSALVGTRTIAKTNSNSSDLSPLTAPDCPSATMEENPSNVERSLTMERGLDVNSARVPTKTSAPSSSNSSELSPPTTSGHPLGQTEAEESKVVRNDRVPTKTIAPSNSNSSELSPLTASGHPMRRTKAEELLDSGRMEIARVPKEAITRTTSSGSDMSSVSASGHPIRHFKAEDSVEVSSRVPTKAIAASDSNTSDLLPMTASGHPIRHFKAEESMLSPNGSFPKEAIDAPSINNHDLSPLSASGHPPRRNSNSPKLDRTPPPSVKKVRGRSRDDSGDTDKRLLHGTRLEDDSFWSKPDGRVLEIQIPTDLMDRPQDSFSTLDSESLAADSLMSSTRFESTPQQVMSKRASDVSPVPPRRPERSPKIGDPRDEGESPAFSSSQRRGGGRKHLGSEEGSRRRSEQSRRRSLDLASVSERYNESYNMDNSIVSISMNNISTSMHNTTSRRNYMRRDLSISSFTNHSRRNLKRQSSMSSFANSRFQNSMSSLGNTGSSRRNLMSRSSSKRSIVDESPSMPKRYLSIDVDLNVSNLDMSMSSLTSKAEASRQRRMERDQSPMRPRRTLDKVVSPGVETEDDEESLLDGSFASRSSRNESLPKGSLPSSMRDVSPTRPRRTIIKKTATILFNDDDDDNKSLPKGSFPKGSNPKDKYPRPLPQPSPVSTAKGKKELEQLQPAPPPSPTDEEKKEHEKPIVLDYIPPPPPLPVRGVPVNGLRRHSRFEAIEVDRISPPPPPLPPRRIAVDESRRPKRFVAIKVDRISQLPQSSNEKSVKNVKASPSPTEITASTQDSEYQRPSLDKESPATSSLPSVTRVENGASQFPVSSSASIRSPVSDTFEPLALERKPSLPFAQIGERSNIEDDPPLHSSADTEGSFMSAASTSTRRAQARAALDKLNSRMNSAFGDGVKAQTTVDLKAPASDAIGVETRRSSLEEKRQEAKAARERLRQRFTNARARVQSQLM